MFAPSSHPPGPAASLPVTHHHLPLCCRNKKKQRSHSDACIVGTIPIKNVEPPPTSRNKGEQKSIFSSLRVARPSNTSKDLTINLLQKNGWRYLIALRYRTLGKNCAAIVLANIPKCKNHTTLSAC
jgi:hypothetical protein